ncbi:hypothetical protein M9Y10_009029 [Tritrichomonas musculus]|uniref:Uncharacterized protein n=1 Tax=Tritrichomonas musculus TaxID=1915356 RepID=A0ABR2J017_9EUKA
MIEFAHEELDAFDTKQIMVILLKAQGLTYEEIIQQIPQLKFPKTLHTMLMWTLIGRKFISGKTTGCPLLVGDVQVRMLKKELEERADMNHAITIFEAVTVLEKINGDYLSKNYQIAKSLNLRKIEIEIQNSEDFEIERY